MIALKNMGNNKPVENDTAAETRKLSLKEAANKTHSECGSISETLSKGYRMFPETVRSTGIYFNSSLAAQNGKMLVRMLVNAEYHRASVELFRRIDADIPNVIWNQVNNLLEHLPVKNQRYVKKKGTRLMRRILEGVYISSTDTSAPNSQY